MSRINRGITSPTTFRTPQPRDPQYVRVTPDVMQYRQLEQILGGAQQLAKSFGAYEYNKERQEQRSAAEARRVTNEEERNFLGDHRTAVLKIQAQVSSDEDKYRLMGEYFDGNPPPPEFRQVFEQFKNASLGTLSRAIQSDNERRTEQLERATESIELNEVLFPLGEELSKQHTTFDDVINDPAVRDLFGESPEYLRPQIQRWAFQLADANSRAADAADIRNQDGNRGSALAKAAASDTGEVGSAGTTVEAVVRVVDTYQGNTSYETRITEGVRALDAETSRATVNQTPRYQLDWVQGRLADFESELESHTKDTTAHRIIRDHIDSLKKSVIEAGTRLATEQIAGLRPEFMEPANAEFHGKIGTDEGLLKYAKEFTEDLGVSPTIQESVEATVVEKLRVIRNDRATQSKTYDKIAAFDADPISVPPTDRTAVFEARDRRDILKLIEIANGFEMDSTDRSSAVGELQRRMHQWNRLASQGVALPTGVKEIVSSLEKGDSRSQTLAVRMVAMAQGELGSPSTQYAARLLFRKRDNATFDFDSMAQQALEEWGLASTYENSDEHKKNMLESFDLRELPPGTLSGIPDTANASSLAEESLWDQPAFRIPFNAHYSQNSDAEAASHYAVVRLREQRLAPISDANGAVLLIPDNTGRLSDRNVTLVKDLTTDEFASGMNTRVRELLRKDGIKSTDTIGRERYTITPDFQRLGSLKDKSFHFVVNFVGGQHFLSITEDEAAEILGVPSLGDIKTEAEAQAEAQPWGLGQMSDWFRGIGDSFSSVFNLRPSDEVETAEESEQPE